MIFCHIKLTVHFICFYPDPIIQYFGVVVFDLERRYAAPNAATSSAVLSGGRSKNISSNFVGILLRAPVIIMHAALYRCTSSDLAKVKSMLSHHAIAAYVIVGIITRL